MWLGVKTKPQIRGAKCALFLLMNCTGQTSRLNYTYYRQWVITMANVTVTLKTKFYWYTKPVLVASYIYWRLFGKGDKPNYPQWAFKIEVV